MNLGIELLQKERTRVTEARNEMDRLLGSFDHVLSYLAHRAEPVTEPEPEPVTVETVTMLPAAARTSRAGVWDREIVNAINSGAHKAGEIWDVLRQRLDLPDDRRDAFYQALATSRGRRLIYRKGTSYFVRKATR